MRNVPMQNNNNKLKRLYLLLFIAVCLIGIGLSTSVYAQRGTVVPKVVNIGAMNELNELEAALDNLQSNHVELSTSKTNLLASLTEVKARVVQHHINIGDIASQLEVASNTHDDNVNDYSTAKLRFEEVKKRVDDLVLNKRLVTKALSELSSIKETANSDVTKLEEDLRKIVKVYLAEKDQSQSSLEQTILQRDRFALLTQAWEQRVNTIIGSYREALESTQGATNKAILGRYVDLLENLLNRYRILFAQIMEVYDSQIVATHSMLAKMKVEYETVQSQVSIEIDSNKGLVSRATGEIEEKNSQLNTLETQTLTANNQLASAQGNQSAMLKDMTNSENALEFLLEQEKAIKATLATDTATENQLLADIEQVDIQQEVTVTEIAVMIEKIAEFIANTQPKLTRDERIHLAKENLKDINYVNSGRCQASQEKGVLVACFLASNEGIVRVTHQEFLDIGINLTGVPKDSIGVFATEIDNVPVYVEAEDLIDETSFIEVVTKGYDSVYSDARMYQVFVNFDKPFNQSVVSSELQVSEQSSVSSAEFEVVVDHNNHFSNSARNDGGWYDPNGISNVWQTSKATLGFEFSVDENLQNEHQTKITYNYGKLLTKKDNFKINAKVNGILVLNNVRTLKGVGFVEESFLVPNNVLNVGVNTLTFEVTKEGTGLRGSIEIDGFTVNYIGSSIARNGVLDVKAAYGEGRSGTYTFSGMNGDQVVAYALSEYGTTRFESSEGVQINAEDNIMLSGVYEEKVIARSVADSVELFAPRKYSPLPMSEVEYLIISHPDFIDSQAMDDFVAFRSMDYQVGVADVQQIYAQYNGGTFDAFAIKDYLKKVISEGSLQMVLLVGDDTFDYKNTLKTNTKSFIPSLYYSYPSTDPSDFIFVDVNDDYLPEVGIGRMPVESSEELANIVEKTILYENHDYPNTALMVTNYSNGLGDAYDSIITRSFPYNSSVGYGANWDLNKILINPEDGKLSPELVAANRDLALQSLSDGVSLTIYTGHNTIQSGHVLNDSHIPLMTNQSKPTVLMSIDSYTGRYIQDDVGSYGSVKAESMLVAKDAGAAAVFANASSNSVSQYQIEVLKHLFRNDDRLGDAHKKAFVWAAGTGRAFYNLFGDPALRIKTSY